MERLSPSPGRLQGVRWAGLLAMTAALGCRPQASPRAAVEGLVTLDGKPLNHGAILFIPQAGTKGAKAGAAIAQGRYVLAEADGAAIGLLRVEIWNDAAEGMQDIRRPQASGAAPDPSVPLRYNSQSEMTVTTAAGVTNHFDFNLVSEKP